MAIRSDITIDWASSPRIITIDAPSTEITMQDLYDTLRYREALHSNIDEDSIVTAGGLEELGGGVRVGLTITLLNAKLAFAARGGPTFDLCLVGGGNLVAVDSVGTYFASPIYPTAYVQVVLANSSSATLQDLEALQAGSYQGEVAVDPVNGVAGTTYNIGTHENPSNNWTDAVFIAESRGLERFVVHGSVTVDGTADLRGYIIAGQNPITAYLKIVSSAQVQDTQFVRLTIASSVLDGNNWLEACNIGNLVYVEGRVENCLLHGTITLNGSQNTYFVDCKSACVGLGTIDLPILDLVNGPQHTAFRNWAGPIKIVNSAHADNTICMDVVSGATVILDSTCTAGTIFLRGITDLQDNSGPGFTVIKTAHLDPVKVSEMWAIMGLDPGNPLTDTLTRRYVQSSAIVQTHTGDPQTNITTTRQ